MSALDSFSTDHTKMGDAPFVRNAKEMETPEGSKITIFDLRFCEPNKSIMSERGIHTMEHLFAGFMRKHLNGKKVKIVDISPYGCRTGFVLTTIGTPSDKKVAKAWLKSMQDVLKVQDQSEIPELNIYQCGTYKMHSLTEAKGIAYQIILDGIATVRSKDILLSDEDLKQIAETGTLGTPDTLADG